MRTFIALLCACFIVAAFAAVDTTLLNDAVKKAYVHRLNTYKCMHGQDAANFYKYHDCIAEFSQNWADEMAKTSMKHSPNSYAQKQCSSKQGFGENIGAGYGSVLSFVDALYAEVECWDFENHKENGCVTGHFTALIWKDCDLTSIGVARKDGTGTPYYAMHMGSSTGQTANMNLGTEAAKQVTPIDKTRTKASCEAAIDKYDETGEWNIVAIETDDSQGGNSAPFSSMLLAFIALAVTMFF